MKMQLVKFSWWKICKSQIRTVFLDSKIGMWWFGFLMGLDTADKSILKRSTVMVLGLIVGLFSKLRPSSRLRPAQRPHWYWRWRVFRHCRHVNVDVGVVVVAHVVDFHVLGRRQSWCSVPHCRQALAPASISTVWPPSLDCQRFDFVLEAKIETSLLGDGERQGVGNFGQLRRKLRPEPGCSRLLWQVGNNCRESIKGSFPESLAKQLRRLMSLSSLQYPDGTRVRQVLSTMTLPRDVENVECTTGGTGGRGTAGVTTSTSTTTGRTLGRETWGIERGGKATLEQGFLNFFVTRIMPIVLSLYFRPRLTRATSSRDSG